MTAATQKIFRIRRSYNVCGAETMENYALRYMPRKFRRCSELRVADMCKDFLSFSVMSQETIQPLLVHVLSLSVW